MDSSGQILKGAGKTAHDPCRGLERLRPRTEATWYAPAHVDDHQLPAGFRRREILIYLRAAFAARVAHRASLGPQLTRIGLTTIMVFPGRFEIGCSNGLFEIVPWKRWLN